MYNGNMSIKIRLTDKAHRVKPETVKLKDLATLLSETEVMLLSQIARHGHDKTAITVALTSIEHESLSAVLGDNPLAENALSEIAHAIMTKNYRGIAERSIDSLRKYIDLSRKLDCDIEIHQDSRVCATLTKDTVIPDNAMMTEHQSVLYGKVIAVGNKKLSVKLELPNGRLLTFAVNEAQARQLGKRLLDDVMLYGDKVIDLLTQETTDFHMTAVDESYGALKNMPVNEWVSHVRAQVDFSRLDQIGADAYMKSNRGED